MTHSLYVLGPPGVGKSTLCHGLLQNASPRHPERKIHGLLYGHDLTGGGVYLGKVREDFPGTDGLAMSVGPDAIEWLKIGELPELIFGEGARLGYAEFLNTLAERTTATIIHLTAKDTTLDQRCAARGSTQKAAWRKGAATRAASALARVKGAKIIEIATDGLKPEHVLRLARAGLPPGLDRLR